MKKIVNLFKRIISWLNKVIKLLTPAKLVILGATAGVFLFTIAVVLFSGLMSIGELGFFNTIILLIFWLAYIAFLSWIIVLGINVMHFIPNLYRWAIIAAAILISNFFSVNDAGTFLILFIVVVFSSLAGGSIWFIRRNKWKDLTTLNKTLSLVSLISGILVLTAASYWFLMDGYTVEPPENAALKSVSNINLIESEDPSEPGEYKVLTLFYGSGKDKHREEFGENADIITDSIDGSDFIDNWKGFSGWVRTKFWGFDSEALPLNARVWYPEGDGPFPLILVVHGNHSAQDYSDPGYDYLGELLASRGFILASVDENFINGSWSNIFEGLKEENDARGWLLLKHLELWHSWNSEKNNPFYDLVDLGNISLIGHSRGGEAVAIAACFNHLPCYPDDANIPFNFNFNIRSVVAIAPVDGQYKPADISTFFENVSYFVLHGSHDGDMQSFHGSRQYERIKFTDNNYHFKAGLYIYGANHGQFNTSWGRYDRGYPSGKLLNLRPIMPKEDQEKIAKVFISAFMETTLKNKEEYIPLFINSLAGKKWLPETIYLNQFEDSKYKYISTYDEDIDVLSITVPEGSVEAKELTIWREQMVKLKWGEKDTRAVYVGWNKEQDDSLVASYSIILPDTAPFLDSANYFLFSMADTDENPEGKKDKEKNNNNLNNTNKGKNKNEENNEKKEEKESKEDKDKDKESIDLTIELEDISGNRSRLLLSSCSYLQPQIKINLMKAAFMTDNSQSENIFRNFEFSKNEFIKVNPEFLFSKLRKISFIFDQSEKGVVIIDNIGFR